MPSYLWSPSKLQFIPSDVIGALTRSGQMPNDAMPVSADRVALYNVAPPAGYTLGCDKLGQPTWVISG